MAFAGTAAEIDPQLIAQFGGPSDDQVLILPLLLKDKVAALVYADGGDGTGKMDAICGTRTQACSRKPEVL